MDGSGELKARFLVLGPMPAHATPETHLAGGPWCFAGNEKAFPDWERNFTFAPQGRINDARLRTAAEAAHTLALRSIPEIAAFLDPAWQKHEPIYWQMLLLPWALAFSRLLVHHAMRVDALLEGCGGIPLEVELLRHDGSFNFADEQDFIMRGALDARWTQWLLTRLLSERWPAAWRCSMVEGEEKYFTPLKRAGKSLSFPEKLKNIARKMALRLPFPPLKGMSIWQGLRFSKALAHSCKTSDSSLDLDREFDRPDSLAQFTLPSSAVDLMLACLPLSLKNLSHAKLPQKVKRPRLRLASINAYEDAGYRQQLALWRESGNRLAWAQHGSNYGQVRVACDAPLIEYSQQLFFTWGWDRYAAAKGNFIPMPSPQLAAISGQWRRGDRLIFVGTEMATTPYRLDSRPDPLDFLAYRQHKADFFARLPQKILAKSLYRPYFRLPGCLEDAGWLFARVNSLKECTGPLLPQILNCRLLVLDHPGTTMLEGFAADIPMVFYWNRQHWRLAEECDKLLDELEKCGIWHNSPGSAADFVTKIWNDVEAWHQSPETVRARNLWKNWQALTTQENVDEIWLRLLKKL